MHRLPHNSIPTHRRGSVILIVMWAIALASTLCLGIQISSGRQSTMGREATSRVQARWAARAGIEQTIMELARHTDGQYITTPVTQDAWALIRDMDAVAFGELSTGSYEIVHQVEERTFTGPVDEHARMNINHADPRLLLILQDEDMDDFKISQIMDWLDADDEVRMLGGEAPDYQSYSPPYEPRNGPMQSIAEAELIGEMFPKDWRGEDWNLNYKLDPNENDKANSFPANDNGDDRLDAGLSQYLTVYSRAFPPTESGEPRLVLGQATVEELTERLGVDEAQAQALISFGATGASMGQLIGPGLSELATGSGANNNSRSRRSSSPANPTVDDLTDEQKRLIFVETTNVEVPLEPMPGKLNVNTISEDLLGRMMEAYFTESMADEIIKLRKMRSGGIRSVADFEDIPGVTDAQLEQLVDLFDTQSNVYTIVSRGIGTTTGQEVEIIVVVDRSTLPIQIIEYREQ